MFCALHKYRIILLFLFFILSSIIFSASCNRILDDTSDTKTETEVPTDSNESGQGTYFDTAPATDDETVTSEGNISVITIEDKPQPTDPHPGDSSLYNGVIISMVYGTGKNSDAAISNGFIQLYNSSSQTVSLKGACLYYQSGKNSPYTRFIFPDNTSICTEGYYLIRANSPDNYDTSNAVFTVNTYDAEWDITIDNKEFNLLLAPIGWLLTENDDITSFDDAVSLLTATESFNDSVYAVNNLSKNKVIIRTALETYSGYHTRNVTEMTSGELFNIRPAGTRGVCCSEVISRLDEVRFSFDAGVYDAPILLELRAGEGYQIYYTTDGSDPRYSTTQKIYSNHILLDDTSSVGIGQTTKTWARQNGNANPAADTLPGAYVIKAYAKNGELETAVFTNTYFIDDSITLNNISIISLSIPINEIFGNKGFYSNYCPTGVITDTRPRGNAVMEVFDKNGSRVGNSNVELAVSGNGSSGWAMKSLRIYYKGSNNQTAGTQSELNYDIFDGTALNANGQAITSFSRLLLRNSGNDCADSYIRDAYMQASAQGLYVDHMASASTFVFINGEFWGIYNIRERYSPEYVESHYGINKDNVAVIESDYSKVHTDANAPYVLSSGIEGDQDCFNEMITFMRNNSLSDTANYQHVCELMDIDSFIDMYVVRIFYVATDWPNNNIKIWRNRNPDDPSGMDTKWHFTLLDLDMGLSWTDGTAEGANFFGVIYGGSVCGDMMKYLLQNKNFKNQFICRFYEVTTKYLTSEKLSELFTPLKEERDALMPLQSARWGREGASVKKWNTAAVRIQNFIQNRQRIVLNQLYSTFGVTEADILNMSTRRIVISFDDTRAEVTYNGVLQESNEIHEMDNRPVTFTIHAKALEGYELKAIIWNPITGDAQRVDTDSNDFSAEFTATCSGTVNIVARAVSNDSSAGIGGQLVAGATYMYYIDKNGDLYAWGDNRYGILGLNSDLPYVTVPTLVMHNVAKVSTTTSTTYEGGETNFTTAIITKNGDLYTVGRNDYGQLGRNGTTNSNELKPVETGFHVKDVAVGNDHTVVVDTNGNMYGVGHNNYQQIGTGCGEYTTTFVKICDNVVSVSAGRRSTTLIKTDGNLYGLGDNRWEKMVDGGPSVLSSPTLMMKSVAFCASGQHQCAFVTKSGDLYYAGWRPFNTFQQGSGNNPTCVKVMDGVRESYLFIDDMVILCENGDVYVYGLNAQNSIGSTVTGGKPKYVNKEVTSVTVGYGFSAYLYRDGTIEVQGDNAYGQAGNGTRGGSVQMAEVYR